MSGQRAALIRFAH